MDNNLEVIFDKRKTVLKKYEPPLLATHDYDSRYELWSIKDVVINNKKKKEVYFAKL